MVSSVFANGTRLVPPGMRQWIARRFDRSEFRPALLPDGTTPSYDLVRASVNLMVASALIAWATSLKLPLSTTYVTFMVAMGTSLSDQAWGRDSAVYRVTGVLTVIGGWFFTAIVAFTVASLFATAIYFGKAPAVIGLLCIAILMVARTRLLHRRREREEEATEVFNLRKIRDAAAASEVTIRHAGTFLAEARKTLDEAFDGLFQANRAKLRSARQGQRRLQQWSNVITANLFKVLRLARRAEGWESNGYSHIVSSLQEIAESVRDVSLRAHLHVANNHSGLLAEQVTELDLVRTITSRVLDTTARELHAKRKPDLGALAGENRALRLLVDELDRNQAKRIGDNTSKTRLSILFYSLMWDCLKITEQTTSLLATFSSPLELAGRRETDGAGSGAGPADDGANGDGGRLDESRSRTTA